MKNSFYGWTALMLIFLIAASYFSLAEATPDFSQFDTLLVLGNKDHGVTDIRVAKACEILTNHPNFNKVILSGGKTDGDIGQSGTSEAEYMDQKLRADCSGYLGGYGVYLETSSGSTKANYLNTIKYVSSGDKLLVLSSQEHVKSVAYCYKYHNQIDAAYYFIGQTTSPVIPDQDDICGQDYGNIITDCMGLPNDYCQSPQQLSSQQTSTSSTQYKTQEVEKTVVGCDSTQRCKEIDQVWNKISLLIGGEGASQVWDHNLGEKGSWNNFKDVYYETKQVPVAGGGSGGNNAVVSGGSASAGIVGQSGKNLLGPSFLCTGNEGLPTATYQNKAKTIAWNSDGKTFEQLAKEIGLANNLDPAVLTTHMVLESSMEPGPYCTYTDGIKKSILTGCGWTGGPNGCAGGKGTEKYCSCTSPNVLSDKGQVECTAKSTYVQNGNIRSTGAYAVCNQYQSDPAKRWACLLCVYEGSYDSCIGSTCKQNNIYFTKDDTCQYVSDFTEQYCPWRNYFSKQGFYQSAPASPASSSQLSAIPANQFSGAFSFVVLGDAYSGGEYEVIQKIYQAIPNLPSKPLFVISVGDMTCVTDGGCGDLKQEIPGINLQDSKLLWNKLIFEPVSHYLTSKRIGFYPTLGNHDYTDYDWAWTNYLSNLNVITGESFPYNYAFYAGNSYFISMNDIAAPTVSAGWLSQQVDAAQRSGAEHIFVFAHKPFDYLSKENLGLGNDVCNKYGPVLQNQITAFFVGHVHVFDYRIIPQSHNGKDKSKCAGIVQVTSGVSGAGVRTHESGDQSKPGILLVTVDGDRVALSKWNLVGDELVQTNFNPATAPGATLYHPIPLNPP